MKKILSIFLLSVMTFSCSNQKPQGTAVVKDNDELSLNSKSLLKAYLENDFSLWEELLSDDCEVLYNNDTLDKKTMIEGFKQQHSLFSSFSLSEDYSHTNYFNNGDIWTNHWFTVKAIGNFTGETDYGRAHTDLKWENGKVVVFQLYSDPSLIMKEATAMSEMSK